MKKNTLILIDPGIEPVSGRMLVSALQVDEPKKTSSGLLLPKHLTMDKDLKLTRKNPDIFVVVKAAVDIKVELPVKETDGTITVRTIKPGDVIIPITRIEYQRQDDGQHRRVDVYQYPVFVDDNGTPFYFIDQYEAMAVHASQYDVNLLTYDEFQEFVHQTNEKAK